LNDFERAAMASLGAELIVPIRRGEDLTQILCLGPKRSGDVYTPVDLSGLARVADRVSAQLARFDDAEVLREAREMQVALRRYVPGPIVEELASGHEIVSERREVSVLFVDIRGYTAYAEGRRVEEIFSTVNAYTELVSKVIRDHGGAVVEFNGDGMMAVFGAPHPLPAKEQAAISAAREVIRAVGGLGDAEPIAVGVGIATGDAYVGNIQAADRLIWTALGNTTNLAARLQALTRELEAEIIIDSETAEAASEATRGFVSRTGLRIRGRSEPRNVYVLPLDPRDRGLTLDLRHARQSQPA
jgi:class 3 adenylate cyclase